MTIREAIDFQFADVNIDRASKRELDDLHAARNVATMMMIKAYLIRQKEVD